MGPWPPPRCPSWVECQLKAIQGRAGAPRDSWMVTMAEGPPLSGSAEGLQPR